MFSVAFDRDTLTINVRGVHRFDLVIEVWVQVALGIGVVTTALLAIYCDCEDKACEKDHAQSTVQEESYPAEDFDS